MEAFHTQEQGNRERQKGLLAIVSHYLVNWQCGVTQQFGNVHQIHGYHFRSYILKHRITYICGAFRQIVSCVWTSCQLSEVKVSEFICSSADYVCVDRCWVSLIQLPQSTIAHKSCNYILLYKPQLWYEIRSWKRKNNCFKFRAILGQ